MLVRLEDSPTQRRYDQFSAICSEQFRRLRQNAKEMQREEIGFVYDLVVPKQFIFVIIRPIDEPTHLQHHGARQVASVSQFQSAGLLCSSEEKQRIGRDRRVRDFFASQIGFETDCLVVGRRFIVEGIETVEIEQCPGRLNAIQPTTTSKSSKNPSETM